MPLARMASFVDERERQCELTLAVRCMSRQVHDDDCLHLADAEALELIKLQGRLL